MNYSGSLNKISEIKHFDWLVITKYIHIGVTITNLEFNEQSKLKKE